MNADAGYRLPSVLVVLLACGAPAAAHVGSPDVFHEGQAGPYRLLVTVRPPPVIPGVAEIEVRSASPDVVEVRIVPLGITGAAAKFAPVPDLAVRSTDDPQFFTGQLWLMAVGSWKVRVTVTGPRGTGELAVPVPALPQRTLRMRTGLGTVLSLAGLLLAMGLVAIVRASVRDAQTEPGSPPDQRQIRRARIATVVALVVVTGALVFGGWWWTLEAESYARIVYKPLQLAATFDAPQRLELRLRDPGWLATRKLDDLVPDHGHLMHLFVVRVPELDALWHFHPAEISEGVFAQTLPAMPIGRYQLFADIVHENGMLETAVAELDLPAVSGATLRGDDSTATAGPYSSADRERTVSPLSNGARMVWRRDRARAVSGRAQLFTFRVEDATGQPATDLELYMGMPGHAVFVRADRSVFAHVHPDGTAPMAAVALAAGVGSGSTSAGVASGVTRTSTDDPHAGHVMTPALPAEISFPYGYPKPGDYRIFVQVKRAGRVETGVFDVRVE